MSIKKHDRNKIMDLDDNDSENEELNYEKHDQLYFSSYGIKFFNNICKFFINIFIMFI